MPNATRNEAAANTYSGMAHALGPMPIDVPHAMSSGVARRPTVRPIASPEITTPSPIVRRVGGVWFMTSVRSLE